MTNTTASFSAVLGFTLNRIQGREFGWFDIIPDEELPLPVPIEGQRELWVGSYAEYRDGSSCDNGDPGDEPVFSVIYGQQRPLAPNETAVTEFSFVVFDYFTPAIPDGDVGSYGLVFVQPILQIAQDAIGFGSLVDIDGPGVMVIDAQPWQIQVIPLDGS